MVIKTRHVQYIVGMEVLNLQSIEEQQSPNEGMQGKLESHAHRKEQAPPPRHLGAVAHHLLSPTSTERLPWGGGSNPFLSRPKNDCLGSSRWGMTPLPQSYHGSKNVEARAWKQKMHEREDTVSRIDAKRLHILFVRRNGQVKRCFEDGPHRPHRGIHLVGNSPVSGATRKTIHWYILQGMYALEDASGDM
jgi:hypothetical protein